MDLSETIQADPALSADVRGLLEREIRSLLHHFSTIEALDDEGLRETGLQAIASALQVGSYISISPKILPKLLAALEKVRSKPMHRGRSRPDIQAIIELNVRTLWKKNKNFIGEPSGTARYIYKDVAAEIEPLTKVPEWWKPRADETGEGTIARRVDVIRKRVARMTWPDE